MQDKEFRTFLKNHPRMTSLLLGATLLLAQVGVVAANNGCTYSGP